MRAIMLKCCVISQNFNDFVRGFFVIKKSVIFHVSSYNQYTTFAHPSIIKLKFSFFHSTLLTVLGVLSGSDWEACQHACLN